MKKAILFPGLAILLFVFGIQAYFAFIPPPKPTFSGMLAEVLPGELAGWKVRDLEMADTPEASIRVSEFLDFNDSIFRTYTKDDTQVGIYIAYWSPGKVSYRWAGAHTPDTCWVQAGWDCTQREHSVPFQHGDISFQPAEFGVYETKTDKQNVYFWHLVGSEAYSYEQQGGHNIFAALVDVRHHGLNLRKEQFFIRLSSNKALDELKQMPGFSKILDSLADIGLATSH